MVAQRGTVPGPDGVPPICDDAVEACLRSLAQFAGKEGCSVHILRIGWDLAGGKREDIESMIQQTGIVAGALVLFANFG